MSTEMPMQPASSASPASARILAISSSVACAWRLRSSPMTAARSALCPTSGATFGPSGSVRRCARYACGESHDTARASQRRTSGAGRFSTRRKMSASACGSPTVTERLQLPITTVVTPWRTDSASPGAISTSTS